MGRPLPELDPQQATASSSLRSISRRLLTSQRETVIASLAVLSFCAVVSVLLFILSWLAHNERHGVGFWDFVKLAF